MERGLAPGCGEWPVEAQLDRTESTCPQTRFILYSYGPRLSQVYALTGRVLFRKLLISFSFTSENTTVLLDSQKHPSALGGDGSEVRNIMEEAKTKTKGLKICSKRQRDRIFRTPVSCPSARHRLGPAGMFSGGSEASGMFLSRR